MAIGDEEYELRPAAMRVYDADADAKIVDWRLRCFVALGFTELDASAMAVRRDVDRDHVERLVKEGCSVGLILDIVL